MKTLIKFLYLSLFVFFAISSKQLRFAGIYSQARFINIAKEVGLKLSSDKAAWLTAKIVLKVKTLKAFMQSQDNPDPSHEKAVSLTDDVNDLVEALVVENKSSYIYRCFVRFT
ncbi:MULTISPECIES: hypothetical protein [Colwellia]|uniref:Uncharacterized protein n=1 Tax=Colwellia marinimaniae TaxID=1513592 RepID=A0ABQ0MYU3_9GAMM|nr:MULTISPECIES: hypothetical protein [Colwellia]GAW97532.1 hypothetical protein MTCD1_03159 [Colwellia marinimaniae]